MWKKLKITWNSTAVWEHHAAGRIRKKNKKKLPKGCTLAYHCGTYIGCTATTALSRRNHRVLPLWSLQRCVSTLQRVPSSKHCRCGWGGICSKQRGKERNKKEGKKCRKHSERFRRATGIVTIWPNLEHIFSFPFFAVGKQMFTWGGWGRSENAWIKVYKWCVF